MNKNYKHNPFAGVFEEDIETILVPKFNVDDLIHQIHNTKSLAIEFIGKQGRGKTTHLVYLHKKMEHYPLFLCDENTNVNDIINNKSDVVFIDSIHHLNFLERVKIFKAKKIVIYTTHWSRKIACLLAQKNKLTLRFKGINKETLHEIINKRLELASRDDSNKNTIHNSEINKLIDNFGDNYRGIINHLYKQYQ